MFWVTNPLESITSFWVFKIQKRMIYFSISALFTYSNLCHLILHYVCFSSYYAYFYCQPDQVNIFGFLYQFSTLCSVYCLLSWICYLLLYFFFFSSSLPLSQNAFVARVVILNWAMVVSCLYNLINLFFFFRSTSMFYHLFFSSQFCLWHSLLLKINILDGQKLCLWNVIWFWDNTFLAQQLT